MVLMGKQNLYEPHGELPFIVKGPGLEAGKTALKEIFYLFGCITNTL